LPYRDDVQPRGEYVFEQRYRSRGDENGVYQFMGTPERPWWWCFGVEFIAAIDREADGLRRVKG